MAFDEKEQAILRWAVQNGKTKDEATQAIIRYRTTGSPADPSKPIVSTPPKQDFLAETGTDIAETVSAVSNQFGKTGEEIVKTATDKQLNPLEKFIQGASQAFRGGARAFGETVIGAGKTVLPQEAEDSISKTVQDVGTTVAQDENVKKLINNYNTLDPETKRNVDNALGFAEGLAEIVTGGAVSKVTKPIAKATSEAVVGLSNKAKTLVKPLTQPIAPVSNKLGADLVKDLVPTRSDLRDRLVANSLRLAPVEDLARIKSATGNDVGEFLGRYELIGDTPEETLETLRKFKIENYNAVRDSIALVEQRFNKSDIPQIDDTIDFLIKDLGDRKSPEYQQAWERLSKLRNQQDFDLMDAQYVKEVFDDVESVYKRTGDVRDAVSAQDKAGTIAPVRRFIENTVKQEYPDIDIRSLNNNVQTAREISDAVIKRSGKFDTESFFRLGDLAVVGVGNFHVPGAGYAAFFGKKLMESAPIQLRIARAFDKWERTGKIDKNGLSKEEIKQINELIRKELGAQLDIQDF